jgi:hypothetical protein
VFVCSCVHVVSAGVRVCDGGVSTCSSVRVKFTYQCVRAYNIKGSANVGKTPLLLFICKMSTDLQMRNKKKAVH